MVKALYSHFEIIRKTCFEDRAKENYLGLGTEELIAYSNKELKDLEKELRLFNVIVSRSCDYTPYGCSGTMIDSERRTLSHQIHKTFTENSKQYWKMLARLCLRRQPETL